MSRRVSISMRAARSIYERLCPGRPTSQPAFAWDAEELRRAMKPKRKAQTHRTHRPRKPSKEEKRESRASIREKCLERANGVCECGCGRSLTRVVGSFYENIGADPELDHMWGRGKGRRPESVETCWILRADCHREKTLNHPDAATWWRKFIAHCLRQFTAGGLASNAWMSALDAARARLAFVRARASLPAAPRTGGRTP